MDNYSGEGVYRTNFNWTDICHTDDQLTVHQLDVKPDICVAYSNVILQIKRLYCAATVYINEQNVGDIWKAPYTLDITDYLAEGDNSIEIRVVNTLFNQIISPDQEQSKLPAIIDQWPYFGNVINNIWEQRQPPYGGCPETNQVPMPSGISGSVILKRWK